MKKLLFIALAFILALGVANAQRNSFAFFPNSEGDRLVSKTYDAGGRLLNTMTYTILDSYDYYDGSQLTLGFVLQGPNDEVLDRGTVNANYADGNFYLEMTQRALLPDVANYLSINTELVGDFLDYPDPYDDMSGLYPWTGFSMDGGEFVIRSKDDRKDFVRVRMTNRERVKSEEITVPAGEFDASRINFGIEVYDNETKKTTHYRGVEWYSVGAGVVRSELYDEDHKLVTYTVLTEMDVKK